MKPHATISYCNTKQTKIRVVIFDNKDYTPEMRNELPEHCHYFDSTTDAHLFLKLNFPSVQVEDSTISKTAIKHENTNKE